MSCDTGPVTTIEKPFTLYSVALLYMNAARTHYSLVQRIISIVGESPLTVDEAISRARDEVEGDPAVGVQSLDFIAATVGETVFLD